MADKTPRRKRRSALLEVTNALLTLVVLGIVAGVGIFVYGAQQFYAAGPKAEEAAFMVEPKSSLSIVSDRLESQGFISNKYVFVLGGKAMKKDSKIKPGQFMIPAKASMADIITLITEGKPVEFFVNVIPGDTSWQVAQHINDPAQNLTGDPVAVPEEGTLLAVRHDFFPGDTRQSLLDGMQQKMKTKVADIWAKHDPAIDDVVKSAADLVTLASVVEKETGIDTERPQVASVFINRLRKGMRLQSDPTIIYGLTQGQGKLDHSLTRKEVESKTPYNTYQVKGLPVGPIANPGEESLLAVAHPDTAHYLYFVAKTADPRDGHYFSSTYAEHKKNVALYRKAGERPGSGGRRRSQAGAGGVRSQGRRRGRHLALSGHWSTSCRKASPA